MPRLSIQIDDTLDDRLNKFLPWGAKQRTAEALLIMLCDAVELHGKGLVGLLLNQEFNLITQEMQKKRRRQLMSNIPGRAMRITIEGASGVGKTRLLLTMMKALREQYVFVADTDNEHAVLVTRKSEDKD